MFRLLLTDIRQSSHLMCQYENVLVRFFSFGFLAENNTYEDVWLILEIVSIHSLSSRVCSSSTVYTALKTAIQSGPEVFGQRFNFASAHNQIIF